MFLLLYILITPILSSYYIFPFTDSSKSKINLCIGTPCQHIHMHLFFSSCVSYILESFSKETSDNDYVHSKSLTYEIISNELHKEQYDLLNYAVVGKITRDNFQITNNNFLHINRYELINNDTNSYFYYTNDNKHQYLLSLCYSPKEEQKSFSILEQLDLKYKVITITEQNVILGKADAIVKDLPHFGKCALNNNDDNQFWKCNLRGLSFHNTQNNVTLFNTKLYDKVIIFEYGVNKTFFPIEMLLIFETEVFGEAIENDICAFGIKNDIYTFTCNDKIFENDIPKLDLEIDSFILTIQTKDLFTYDNINKEYEFGIYATDSNDKFILGKNILEKYTLVYDKTHAYFGLYNKENINYIKGMNYQNELFDKDYYINTMNSSSAVIDYDDRGIYIKMFIVVMGVSVLYILIIKFYLNKLIKQI